MKKLFYIGALSTLLLAACGGDKEDAINEPVEVKENAEVEKVIETPIKEEKPKDAKDEIKEIAEGIISKDFKRTNVNDLEVNNYQGEDNKFIVLPHLKWEVKNGKETTVEMLEMYSDNLAAKLYEQEGIQEITVFWEVPHHLEGDNVAKFNYTRTDTGMAKMDKWLAPVLQ